jgi:uncharacterized protein YbjT (DUF2867 family)
VNVLVAGASGFVGANLCAALVDGGAHHVRAMTRRPEAYTGPATAVQGDVGDPASLREALSGCDAAYYLVHSLESEEFAERDRRGAEAFGDAAARAGAGRVIYLGGLGDENDALSPHLAGRREVEGILHARVPTTVLRAGIVIGDGGISWEILRQLVARLPVMITPRSVQTRTHPIAIDDAVAFLVGVLGNSEARRRPPQRSARGALLPRRARDGTRAAARRRIRRARLRSGHRRNAESRARRRRDRARFDARGRTPAQRRCARAGRHAPDVEHPRHLVPAPLIATIRRDQRIANALPATTATIPPLIQNPAPLFPSAI